MPYSSTPRSSPRRRTQIADGDVEALRTARWDEDGIYDATALISFFNFSGRLEAASGLPPDEVPADATPPEARQPRTDIQQHDNTPVS
jgi:hypothetical protein